MNFATLQGLTIPEGVVTQITDASGRVLWMLQSGNKTILTVEKITSDTYAGETTYTGEQFILLDIYPKTNGTVKVTYGGLTKTIKDTSGAAEPNRQQVFFGTFNGVSDSVTTPASGTLTIEGSYVAFGCGHYNEAKSTQRLCTCVTSITDFGEVEYIPDFAFGKTAIPKNYCQKIDSVVIPSSVTRIGEKAFIDIKPLEVTLLANIPPSLTASETTDAGGMPILVYNNFVYDYVNGSVTFTVPKGCGEVYKTAEGWSKFASYIVEAS